MPPGHPVFMTGQLETFTRLGKWVSFDAHSRQKRCRPLCMKSLAGMPLCLELIARRTRWRWGGRSPHSKAVCHFVPFLKVITHRFHPILSHNSYIPHEGFVFMRLLFTALTVTHTARIKIPHSTLIINCICLRIETATSNFLSPVSQQRIHSYSWCGVAVQVSAWCSNVAAMVITWC